jgi:hypothetical protein
MRVARAGGHFHGHHDRACAGGHCSLGQSRDGTWRLMQRPACTTDVMTLAPKRVRDRSELTFERTQIHGQKPSFTNSEARASCRGVWAPQEQAVRRTYERNTDVIDVTSDADAGRSGGAG